MNICIYHKTMGDRIEAALHAAFADVTVRVVRDTSRDPVGSAAIDVLVTNVFPRGLLGRCSRLRWLHLTSSGVEQAAVEPRPEGLIVTHSGPIPARAVAEFAWMGLLALAKEAPLLLAQQQARVWRLPDARLVAGTRLLLVGLGHVGREIARRAAAFDVRVSAVTRSARPSPLADEVLSAAALSEAARRSDHLVLAAPATRETHRLVGDAVLRALPEHAVVVNVGRPSLLDVDALVEALQAGRLRGALLDVHEDEPLPASSPYWNVPGLWVTPHGAYRFPGEEADMADLVVDNLHRLRTGAPLRNRATAEQLRSAEPAPAEPARN